MDCYHIHGGTNTLRGYAEHLEIHGGIVYFYGDCDNITHNGGVVYDHRPIKNGKVVIQADRMSDDRRNRMEREISDLKAQLNIANRKNDQLREKINRLQADGSTPPPNDDVLFLRIRDLTRKLDEEREQHRKEVDELKWRLEAVTDIANGRNEQRYEDETTGRYIGVTDDSLDVLFTLINEYPICYDSDLSEEYGITMTSLKHIAKVLRLAKSPEQRREARERLRRHGLDLIERRGGDNSKTKRKRKTRKK